ncbi:hypothetical protein D9758_007326 [Tetrapyrgos nigripes]|uniref:FYVE-type domain-containing protein n=1 Tax=Tetrapyrgos nigripes TaxID=182062 RepID=A0A8H5LLJ5_9AGAR|nr:hypothetical protein D9758_007326 [Tetrapyrgos nigripes]
MASQLSVALAAHPIPKVKDVDSTSISSDSTVSTASSSTPALPPLVTAPEEHSTTPLRSNEHLAVLMPKHLWKSDSLAAVCDSFYCRTRFTLLERRHHCRKCGGIFCRLCSSHSTPLLDTSSLPFLHPPRNTPIVKYASPTSPVVQARVCDDCWDQLHGCPSTPRTPELTNSRPIALASASTSSSPSSSSPNTPPNGLGLVVPPHLEPQPTSQGLNRSLSRSSSKRSSNPDLRRRVTTRCTLSPHLPPLLPFPLSTDASCDSPTSPSSLISPTTSISSSISHHQPTPTPALTGPLSTYPLRHSSLQCKRTGGGRWTPQPLPVLAGHRLPILVGKELGKAPFEVEMEKEEERERRRRERPVIRDGPNGEFQIRFWRDHQDVAARDEEHVAEGEGAGWGKPPTRSYSLSTF